MAYNSRRTNPYGPERTISNNPGSGKSEMHKASSDEKKYYKTAVRDIKGKKTKEKHKDMEKRISLGVGPSGDYSRASHESYSKSGYEQMKGLQETKRSFLTKTKQGQKLSALERKTMQKTGSKSQTRFQPSNTQMAPYDESKLGKGRAYTVNTWQGPEDFKKYGGKRYYGGKRTRPYGASHKTGR